MRLEGCYQDYKGSREEGRKPKSRYGGKVWVKEQRGRNVHDDLTEQKGDYDAE